MSTSSSSSSQSQQEIVVRTLGDLKAAIGNTKTHTCLLIYYLSIKSIDNILEKNPQVANAIVADTHYYIQKLNFEKWYIDSNGFASIKKHVNDAADNYFNCVTFKPTYEAGGDVLRRQYNIERNTPLNRGNWRVA
jgi:hypothetical protein